MKKYEEPKVEKIEFNYEEQVVASNCFAVTIYSFITGGCTQRQVGESTMNNN